MFCSFFANLHFSVFLVPVYCRYKSISSFTSSYLIVRSSHVAEIIDKISNVDQ